MIKRIAHIIAEAIRERPWSDRVAGIVIPYTSERSKGKKVTYPVSCDVSGQDCSEEQLSLLLPDQRRRSVIFIEDRSGARRTNNDSGPWVNFQAILRVVGWINPAQMGLVSDCEGCGNAYKIAAEIYSLLPARNTNIEDCGIVGLNIDHYGFEKTGENPWKQYTVDDARSAFLLPPYEYFAMDLVCQWKVHDQCLGKVVPGDPLGCGAPSPVRRKHPKDFTCEELTDATTGLTEEQLGPECLDCEGGGDPVTVASSDGEYSEVVPCGDSLILPDVTNTDSDGTPVTVPAQTPFTATPCVPPTPTTVNGVESDTPAITVVQDGSPVGTLDPLTGEVDIPACPPSDPGYAQLYDDASPTPNPIGSPVPIPAGTTVDVTAPHGTVMTSDGADPVMDVLSGGSANLPQSVINYVDASGAFATTPANDTRFNYSYIYRAGTMPRRELKNSDSEGIGIYASLDGLIDDTIPNIPDSTVNIQRKDSAGTNIGAVIPVAVKATATLAQNVTAPDGSVQPKDSAGTNIGSAVAVKSNGTANATIPDSTITKPDGTTVGLKATQPYDTRPLCPMKVVFPIGSTDAYWVITADEAGSYTAWTDDGSSGTLTYRTGGSGTYIAATGTIALTIGTIIEFKRTVSSAIGYWRWAH